MARARTIKPAFFVNEHIAECSALARLTFIGLWTWADSEGRVEDRPKRIKVNVLPFDPVDLEPLLEELRQHGFIRRYEVSGVRVISIPTFVKHQRPHPKEPPSELPAEPDESRKKTVEPDSSTTSCAFPSSPSLPSLNPLSVIPDDPAPLARGMSPKDRDWNFGVWWKHCPRKVKKKAAKTSWSSAVQELIKGGRTESDAISYLLEAVVAFAESPAGRAEKKYIPHPTSWLNQGRYDDDRSDWNATEGSSVRTGTGSQSATPPGRTKERDFYGGLGATVGSSEVIGQAASGDAS